MLDATKRELSIQNGYAERQKKKTMFALETMHANSEQGLLPLVLTAWKSNLKEICRQKEEAARLDEVLKKKKD